MGSLMSYFEPRTKNEIANITTNDAGDSPSESKEILEEPHDKSDGSKLDLGELMEDRSEDSLGGSAMECFDIEEPHDRSDGSDLGLGKLLENRSEAELDRSECEMIQTPSTSILEQSAQAIDNDAEVSRRGNLKRKSSTENGNELVRKNRRISFDSVTVYYFPREQGSTSVPSQGGSTLVMPSQHTHVEKYSVPEHATVQRRRRGQGSRVKKHVPKEIENAASTSDVKGSYASDTEAQFDSEKLLHPVPTQQRQLLLQAAGVSKIDSTEKDECSEIRRPKNFCGCDCKIFCDPDSCSCSQAGIKCLVENSKFPCGCSRQHCRNSSGRSEFNQFNMKTHVIDTLMRLDLNKNN